MKTQTLFLLLTLCTSFLFSQNPEGELKRWHKISLSFNGPNTSETATPNPFSDFRLDVTFTHAGSNKSYKVPGFYSGCKNPEESSCNSGNIWKVNFAPDRTGVWNWSVAFKKGSNVAVSNTGTSAGFMDGDKGSFTIAESDKTGRDFRAPTNGRLQYVGEHYLRHSGTTPGNPNGKWFVKAGADSPENTLAYEDFDNTPNRGGRRKNWNPHQKDYNANDAGAYTWKNGKGTELLGVINYLASKGANAFSFLTFSLHGDDQNVFPHLLKVPMATYNGFNDVKQWNQGVHKNRFDVSKMAQWERIFEYADKKGLYLHFKTAENENVGVFDNGTNGTQRKLYYRELIARYGHHLALNWNISEEVSISANIVKNIINYVAEVDPYDHNIVLHTGPNGQQKIYSQFLGNQSKLTGPSIQVDLVKNHAEVKKWVNNSRNAGRKWIVANDEQGPGNVGVSADPKETKLVRQEILWGTLLAGGAGTEYYYGGSDNSNQDHRTRDAKYTDVKFALDFFNKYLQEYLPKMVPSDGVTNNTNDFVLAEPNKVYVVYLPNGGRTNINLPGGSWQVQWYNPRTGGALSASTKITNSINAPGNQDWVALIKKEATDVIDPDPDPDPAGGCVALESNGVVAIEAEHFDSLEKTGVRNWYVMEQGTTNTPTPDGDPNHFASASAGGYIEILPDTRRNHGDKLVEGENFSPNAGRMTIVNYKVKFQTTGKYFVWVRAFSTNSEDNGIHVGLDGQWPESGKRMQWCEDKNQWTWASKQRTPQNHCGVNQQIFLNINTPGVHTVSVSMREDGFEMDKLVLNKKYTKPNGNGPDEVLVDCVLSTNDFDLGSNQINIYPNPAANVLTINNLKKSTKVSVYDLYGRKIFNDIAVDASNNTIDISELPSSMYLLVFDNDQILKFLKE
ncbi:DUF5060 domain-containing protein [Aquimarina sp. ERC-38]|uniref:DUF5060 domain-containing protein n=1 Tax=Aquimarina sp. ERC-38 TaxID=2949996 RepID=UPI0022485DC9|nr:DUF5060 domain-containing protein [Aquimarina sp. ERC-38]UZO80706.1 DUF5060 domain-containing protein [Aquimarina sp. ERC-38]